MLRLVACWFLLAGAAGCLGVDRDGDGSPQGADCDDSDPAIGPGQLERCNGLDDDCDRVIDEPGSLAEGEGVQLFEDADGDGFGLASLGRRCAAVGLVSEVAGDCNDRRASVFPGAPEVCNGLDDDCDGLLDGLDPDVDAASFVPLFVDEDRDGWGVGEGVVMGCPGDPGRAVRSGDCDDADVARHPGQVERCNGFDDDCDPFQLVDDADPSMAATLPLAWDDLDGDGYGAEGTARPVCAVAADQASRGGDCDDGDAARNPDAAEVCDGVDADCDGVADDAGWWSTAARARVRVALRLPDPVDARLPVAVPLDLDDVLAQAGVAGVADPSTVRVVRVGCSGAPVLLPHAWLPGIGGLLDGGPVDIDGGTLVTWVDGDGDLATAEAEMPGGPVNLAIYVSPAGTGGLPAPAAALPPEGATATAITTPDLIVRLAPATGLVSAVGLSGRPWSANQNASRFGNGPFVDGAWRSAALGSGSARVVWDAGGVVVLEGAGATSDVPGVRYVQRVVVFAARPEAYVRSELWLDRQAVVGPQGNSWTQAVRPFQVDHGQRADGAGGIEGTGPGADLRRAWAWARWGAAAPFDGVRLGWRRPPVSVAPPVFSSDGRAIGLAGQDLDATPFGNLLGVAAFVRLVDGATAVIAPFTGAADAGESRFLAARTGAEVVRVSPPEARP
jgi:peptidoglycan hydrolase-like protein with peptidoglycan-binding domain